MLLPVFKKGRKKKSLRSIGCLTITATCLLPGGCSVPIEQTEVLQRLCLVHFQHCPGVALLTQATFSHGGEGEREEDGRGREKADAPWSSGLWRQTEGLYPQSVKPRRRMRGPREGGAKRPRRLRHNRVFPLGSRKRLFVHTCPLFLVSWRRPFQGADGSARPPLLPSAEERMASTPARCLLYFEVLCEGERSIRKATQSLSLVALAVFGWFIEPRLCLLKKNKLHSRCKDKY